ncbi:4657_t:CDS:2 [Cetraspora pellucida]|uniref:4657_t:CDS:1 n=1 Tax=Cetraspora pellucida TaxID=1433469 RepID=A0ACA9MM61_9GLOM|nr:4657_t:CDS:2 [Cetraspora pellucida]
MVLSALEWYSGTVVVKDHRQLIRSEFEHYTTPPFLRIRESETMFSILLTSPTIPIKFYNFDNTPYEIPKNDTHTFVESNWPLFEYAFKCVCIEKLANN